MQRIRRALELPPSELAYRGRFRLVEVLRRRYLRHRDRFFSTHTLPFTMDCEQPLARCFPAPGVDELAPYADQVRELTDHYRAHRFDLLGSGWVNVRHGMTCDGIEGCVYHSSADADVIARINPANRAESARIRALISADYTPIDWHLDFKSGYRWDESCYFLDIPYGRLPGVDVKVPWELSRMQHLAQLAWAFALASSKAGDLAPGERYLREFCDQVLDFISANPPRWGVNWFTAMDVAIRAVNILTAYDLLRAYGAEFKPAFAQILTRSMVQHAEHIITHLEYQSAWRSNHYLANVVGLLWIAAYLPASARTDLWLGYGLQELAHEVRYQFNEDGTNFEASTAYHRLSGEMVAYGTAIALALPADRRASLAHLRHRSYTLPVPLKAIGWSQVVDAPRLLRMRQFVTDITTPEGRIARVGDDDSGRFLKLFPTYERLTVAQAKARYANLCDYAALPPDAPYPDEILADARPLHDALTGLFADLPADTLEARLVRRLVGDQALAASLPLPSFAQPHEDWQHLTGQFHSQNAVVRRLMIPIDGGDLWSDFVMASYPDGGYYCFRSKRIYLLVRCGSTGQGGNGGHAHNDQLSCTLYVDGSCWIADPGTYLYTPFPERRNEYRSVKAHFAPRVPTEPAPLDNLFSLTDVGAVCLCASAQGFYGRYRYQDGWISRLITFQENGILVEDGATQGLQLDPLLFPPDQPPVSPKYGSRLNA